MATRISYQGQLTDSAGAPLSGSHDFVFQLWDDADGGNMIGADIALSDVTVTDGVFSVPLEVPSEAFDGRALWLRIGIDGTGLSPRQAILPAP